MPMFPQGCGKKQLSSFMSVITVQSVATPSLFSFSFLGVSDLMFQIYLKNINCMKPLLTSNISIENRKVHSIRSLFHHYL
jgi:hypothetical protein